MKKNIKVLSSLALAGILTTNIMGASLAVTTKDVTSTVPGIYNELISNTKNVLPVILTNKDDIVTIRDIKESGLFGTTALAGFDENRQLRSGETFKVNGRDYTVAIFGDVDKNGTVNVLDALEIAKYAKHLPSAIDGDAIAEVLANVQRKDGSGVNILDALRIQRFVLGQQPDGIIDEVPVEKVTSNYVLTSNDRYINNSNQSSFELEIEVKEKLESNKDLTLKITNPDGTTSTQDIRIAKNEISKSLTVNLSGVTENGIVIFELYEGASRDLTDDAKPVNSCTIEKQVQEPAVAKIYATRENTREASISLEEISGKAEITEIHYAVLSNGASTPASTALTKTLPVDTNNKIKLTDELVEDTAYDVYYQLVDIYGNVSTTVQGPIVIAKGNYATAMAAVEKIEAPDLTTATTFKITCADAEAQKVIVTLYKNDEIILESEETVTAKVSNFDFKAKMTAAGLDYEAGTYKVTVAVKELADGSKTRSEEKTSEVVTVKALKPVTNIKSEYVAGANGANDTIVVTWEDENAEEEVDKYSVYLLKYDDTTKEYVRVNSTLQDVVSGEKKCVFEISSQAKNKINPNESYKVEIIASAEDMTSQFAILDSETQKSKAFYGIAVNGVTANGITDNSVTLNLSADIKVDGTTVTKYKVEIYPYAKQMGTNNTEVEVRGATITKNVNLVDGKIVVDGLAPNTRYEFKLFADVDGVIGESALITVTDTGADIKTLNEIPAITECKIVNKEEDATNKTIYFPTANEVWINGTTKITDYTQGYAQDFQDIITVIKQLNVNDIVTISEDGITLKLDDATLTPVSFNTTAAKGMEITIEGNANKQRTISATTASGLKEVVLQGKKAIFNTDNLNAEKIILTDGVEVINENNAVIYTIAKNSTVIINGVQVKTAGEEIEITATGKNLNVIVDKINSNLAFENLNNAQYTSLGTTATINLEGKDNSSTYTGTITINSLGGEVEVSQTSNLDTSKLNLKVNVTDATVTVDDEFTSKVNMTVTVDANDVASKSELIVTPKVSVPSIATVATIDGLEIKDYEDKEALETALKALTGGSSTTITEDDYTTIMTFIESFGIIEQGITGATIEDNGDNTVTITFTKSVTNLEINGLNVK